MKTLLQLEQEKELRELKTLDRLTAFACGVVIGGVLLYLLQYLGT